MAWYEIFIVSVGLSLDVFTYALYKGAMLSRLDKKQILKMILLFTGWQSGAMLLGSLISELPYIAMNYQRTERLFRAASAVIFFLIGIWLIVRALHMRDPLERREDAFAWRQLCIWAMLTSVDSFVTGNYGCAGGHRRHLCGISDRVSWKKPCTDQWSADLPACRRGCIVSILHLKYRDS